MNSSDYYEKYDRKIDTFFDEEKFPEAVALSQEALNEFPDLYFHITNWLVLCHRGMERFDKCLEVVENGVKKGYCYSLQWKSWDPIRKIEGGKDVLAENDRLLQETQRNATVQYDVLLPENYTGIEPHKLFLTMHCDSGIVGNIEHHRRNWQPDIMLEHGFITAYVQSSQALSSGGYEWSKDAAKRRSDIKQCYDELLKEYAIDPSQVIISGFSGGALAALDIALNNVIPVKGFIAIGPDKPEDFSIEKCKLAGARGTRGVIMEGELCDDLSASEEIARQCDQSGLACEFYINKGVGHWYPDDLQTKVGRAIEFILNI